MKVKQHIPNFLTCCNLLCGCLAIVCAFEGNLVWSAYLVGIAAVFDFFDGFAARMLRVVSPIGKDLDSLADMVTFGVVPGVVIHYLYMFSFSWPQDIGQVSGWHVTIFEGRLGEIIHYCMKYLFPFFIVIFSAIRLARFNNDTRQIDSFIGLPTPANAILICSIPLILYFSCSFKYICWNDGGGHGSVVFTNFEKSIINLLLDTYFLMAISIIQSFLLIAPLPLFALKFRFFGWKGNEIRYVFLGLSLILIITLKFIGIPLIIILYILLSIVNNLLKKRNISSPL